MRHCEASGSIKGLIWNHQGLDLVPRDRVLALVVYAMKPVASSFDGTLV